MLVDLSLPVDEETPVFPTLPGFEREEVLSREEDGVHASRFSMSTHLGTHIDAPAHFFADGMTIDEFPIDLFTGPAYVVDLRHRSGQPITAGDLADATPSLAVTDRVVLVTGDVDAHLGNDFYDRSATLTGDAAEWLVERGVSLVGTDFLTEGVPGEPGKPVHTTLLGESIPIVEHLCNMASIVERGLIEFDCLPLPVVGLDAAPTRAVAGEYEP